MRWLVRGLISVPGTLLLIGIVAAGYVAVALGQRGPVVINYRVAMDLIVDGRPHTAETVWQASFTRRQAWNLDGVSGKVRGEAMTVEAGDRTVYILRRGEGPPNLYYGSFPINCVPAAHSGDDALPNLRDFEGPCDIDLRHRPMLVTFTDESDPSTAQWTMSEDVRADGTCASVCITKITVVRTDDPITTGIIERLPWLAMGVAASKIGTGEIVHWDQGGMRGFLYNYDFTTEGGWPTPERPSRKSFIGSP